MPQRRVPRYRHYKPKDLGLVVIDGQQIYLGKYGSPESIETYNRLIQERFGQNQATAVLPSTAPMGPSPLSVNELCLAFITQHAQDHYRRADGTPTGELANFLDAIRPLRQLHGQESVPTFGPRNLKQVRQAMIDAGLARTTINHRIGRIVHIFKWGVEQELVPPLVYQALKAVRGLQKGRSKAREPEPVRPVPEAHVDAVRKYVSRQVWTMVELQRLTGMRPGEACLMRAGDIDRSGPIWVYSPKTHKTAYRDRQRAIPLGPRAQAVLGPWLREEPTAYLFSPRQAAEERRALRGRGTLAPEGDPRRARRSGEPPRRRPAEHYTPQTYRVAVQRACARAGVPAWHPNQLRHNAATRLRKEFGLDVARAVLGHSSPAVTEVYAELDAAKAAEAMQRIG